MSLLIHSSTYSSIHSFIHSFIHLYMPLFIHLISWFDHSPSYQPIDSFPGSVFICPYHSTISYYISFIHSYIHSLFNQLRNFLSIYSFIRSFVHLHLNFFPPLWFRHLPIMANFFSFSSFFHPILTDIHRILVTDFFIHLFILYVVLHGRNRLSDITDEKFREYKSNMVTKMIQYLCSTSCRRR